jgi:hypothetical protein
MVKVPKRPYAREDEKMPIFSLHRLLPPSRLPYATLRSSARPKEKTARPMSVKTISSAIEEFLMIPTNKAYDIRKPKAWKFAT